MMRPVVNDDGYRWRGLAAMLVGTFGVTLSLSFLFPASPVIMSDFGVSIETVAWLSLAYALGASVFEPMWGRIGDLHGRKRNALMGIGLFTLGGLASALSPSIWAMAGARFVQGFGAAGLIPIGMAFVGENFPQEERGRALGLWGMISGVAPALGPTLGGYLIDWFGWRSIYWASVLLGTVGLAAINAVVRESRRARPEPFDLPGSALLFLWAGSLLVAVNQGRSWGWTSLLTLGFAAGFLLTLALFLAVESRTAHPVVDLSIVRTRLFALAGTAVLVSFLAFQGAFFLIPFLLQQVQGYPASQTGQLVMPLFLGIMGASLVSGRLSDRLGARIPALSGSLLTSLALFLLTLVDRHTGYGYLLLVMATLGVGIGATLPPLSRAITGAVPLRRIGSATGVFNMSRNLGGPFGVALAATIFAHQATQAGTAFAAGAFTEVGNRLAMAGLGPSILRELPHLEELAQSGALDQRQLSVVRDLGPTLQAIQEEARLRGFEAGFNRTALVMFAISLIGVLATLLVEGGRRQPTAAGAAPEQGVEGVQGMTQDEERLRAAMERAQTGRGEGQSGAGMLPNAPPLTTPQEGQRGVPRVIILPMVILILLTVGYFGYGTWQEQQLYVSTDNAQVAGVLTQVGSLNAGRVEDVAVDIGDRVRRDQVVATIGVPSPTGQTGSGTPKLGYRATDDQRVEVRSPIDGVVIARQANPHDTVAAGQPILTVVDPARLWVQAQVDETKIGRVRVGQPVEVRVEHLGRILPGRVAAVDRATASTFSLMSQAGMASGSAKVTQTVPVKIVVDYDRLPLVVGSSVQVKIWVSE